MHRGLKILLAAGTVAGLAFGSFYSLPAPAQEQSTATAASSSKKRPDYDTALAGCTLNIFPIPEPGEKVPDDIGLEWDYDTQEFLMTCMASQGYKPNVPDIGNWDIDEFDVMKAAQSPKFREFDAEAQIQNYIEKVKKQVQAENAAASAPDTGQGGKDARGKIYKYDPPVDDGAPKPIFMPR